MKEKIKSALIVMITAILIVFGISIIVNSQVIAMTDKEKDAEHKHDKEGHHEFPTFSDYEKSPSPYCISGKEYLKNRHQDIFCTEHGQHMLWNDYHHYFVRNIINIDGYSATGYDENGNEVTVNGKENLKLAGVIHYSSTDKTAIDRENIPGENGTGQWYNERQKAVWYMMRDWVDEIAVGNFEYIDANLVSTKHEGKPDGYEKGIEYADEVWKNDGEEKKASITCNSEEARTESFTDNNVTYLKVGPYTLDFYPNLKSIEIYGKISDGEETILTGVKYRQDKVVFDDISAIQQNVPFSILVSSDVTEITKIVFKTGTSTYKRKNIKLSLMYLQTNNWQTQNLVRIKTSESKEPITGEDEVTIKGFKLTGEMLIKKQIEDEDGKKLEDESLAGYAFKLQYQQNGLWVQQDSSGGISYVGTIEEATPFVTDTTGKTPVIKKLYEGNYKVVETDVQNKGCIDKNPNQIEKVTAGKKATRKIVTKTNVHAYTSISGHVWIDRTDANKTRARNDLENDGTEDINDIRYDKGDLTIALWDNRDTSGAKQEVNGKSEYRFDNVKIDDLPYLSVDIYYDGILYAAVSPHVYDNDSEGKPTIYRTNGSKLEENQDRRATFESKFGTVANDSNKANSVLTNNGGDGFSLPYTRANYTASLSTDSTDYRGQVRDPWVQVFASTSVCGFKLDDRYNEIKAVDPSVKDGITDVNLGLYERLQPDIRLEKDVQNIKLSINNKNYIYNYSKKDRNPDGSVPTDIGARFAYFEEEQNQYQRPIYEADYMWESSNPINNPELQVYITYKLKITNETNSNFNNEIGSVKVTLEDHYDVDYINQSAEIKVGKGLDANTDITSEINYTNEQLGGDSEYGGRITIGSDDIGSIECGTEVPIYIQFKLSRKGIKNIITQPNENIDNKKQLKNVTEISSYTTYQYGTTTPRSGIDMDSAPGNATIGDSSTYEDDTDFSPPLLLEKADSPREFNGKVFYDTTNGEDAILTAQIREGSGIWEDNEPGIKDVKVILKEKSGTDLVYYINNGDNTETGKTSGKPDESLTSASGDFKISGFIPGDYELEYTWGENNGTFTINNEEKTTDVQNYKATVYNAERYNANINNQFWYRNDIDTRYTDATDDYEIRQNIDNELKELYYKEDNEDGDIEYSKKEMISTTPEMNIDVEFDDAAKEAWINDPQSYNYEVKNVDFGIVRRAKQDVELTKRVKSFKITLANGEVISEVEVKEEDGTRKLEGEKKHTTYMGPTYDDNTKKKDQLGFIKAELDNELIQGAILSVTYELRYDNHSEVDIVNENYYRSGIGSMQTSNNYVIKDENGNTIGWANQDEVVKTSPIIIDYLDKNWGYEEDKNTHYKWEAMTKEEFIDENEGIIETTKTWKIDKKVYEKNSSEINDRIILYTEKLKEANVLPGENRKIDLNVAKTLTTTDEIDLKNETDLVKVRKNGGSEIETLIPVIGTFIPGGEIKTPSSDTAEEVIVTPSTGEDKGYILPIAIGITAFVILGAGVILIKKKVLGNKE